MLPVSRPEPDHKGQGGDPGSVREMRGEESDHRAIGALELGLLTENERSWVMFLRRARGRDPAPRLRDVQMLQRVLRRHEKSRFLRWHGS